MDVLLSLITSLMTIRFYSFYQIALISEVLGALSFAKTIDCLMVNRFTMCLELWTVSSHRWFELRVCFTRLILHYFCPVPHRLSVVWYHFLRELLTLETCYTKHMDCKNINLKSCEKCIHNESLPMRRVFGYPRFGSLSFYVNWWDVFFLGYSQHEGCRPLRFSALCGDCHF